MLGAEARAILAEMEGAPTQRIVDRLLPVLEAHLSTTGATLTRAAEDVAALGLRRRDGKIISPNHLGRLLSTARAKRRLAMGRAQARLAPTSPKAPINNTRPWATRQSRELPTLDDLVRASNSSPQEK